MNRKYILSVVAGLLACTTLLTAQNQSNHEISTWLGGGLSTLDQKNKGGNDKQQFGGLFGIGYNYHFTDRWSIGSGLELSLYNGKSTVDNFADQYNSNDSMYDFEFRTASSRYQEEQKAMYLNIPLLAQFQMFVTSKHQFYASGGFKIGIPVSSKFKIVEGQFNNSGYYPNWSQQGGRELVMDKQEFMGFGTFNRSGVKEGLNLKTAYILSLETGMRWKIGENTALYTGAYFDYGLNNINKKENNKLLEYNITNADCFVNNSILSTDLSDKVKMMAVGLKVRFAFAL